ncbi:hypothetical protein H7E67_13195 [Clostridium gasigenes]|uniref:hypothetical protein n=1 Tax=Clostridium gasigenes TaxID=94869 RepID=UPI0016276272|nr:hypothetical protein [Clostridium gasigenes]MBB6624391.1 hypothetical protein [Clostridium gasigenes]MBU3088714.1 hypothetical protein [Clostridium gasigenes]MBU3132253.1 hypothetical protein [Clostridium gasigenes]
MNKERLKKLIYDLDITTNELDKSIGLVKQYSDQEELVGEFSNSLKYKYLSLFIIYEDFISMMLKEYTLYEIGMSVDKAIKKLYDRNYITEEQLKFLNSARLIRNKIGHRYKQPPVEIIIEFLETNETVKLELNKFIKSCM